MSMVIFCAITVNQECPLNGPPLLKKQSMIKYTFESTDNRKNRIHLSRNYDATDIDKTRLFTQVTVNAD